MKLRNKGLETIDNLIFPFPTFVLARAQRLDAELAANVMQLYLWAPSSWLKSERLLPSSNEVTSLRIRVCVCVFIRNEMCTFFSLQIMQWLLCLTTKVLCEGRRVVNLPPSHESPHDTTRYATDKEMLSSHSYGRRTMPEYRLIASFLGRVTLGNVKHALTWIQRNV